MNGCFLPVQSESPGRGYIVFLLDNKTEKQPGTYEVQLLLIFIRDIPQRKPGLFLPIR